MWGVTPKEASKETRGTSHAEELQEPHRREGEPPKGLQSATPNRACAAPTSVKGRSVRDPGTPTGYNNQFNIL